MSTIFDLDGISYHSAFAEIEERIYEIKENNNVATPRERRLINSLYNGINSDSISRSRSNSRITSRGNSRSRSRGNSRSRSSTRSKSKSKRKNRNKITRRKRTTKRK
jgi:hypothetical protein